MATSILSKYKHEIIPGSPSIYRLIPKQDTGSMRLTFGKKDLNKINKTILLVGETGTGKSSLINALVNYAMGVKFEDNVCVRIVNEVKKSQSESQTSDVIVYEVFGLEDETRLPFSLTIIDTPGFGDTRGHDKDVLVIQRLLDTFRSKDGVHEIDAVCLVLKATDNRLSDRLRYVFDSVVSLFGKDMEKKIVALVTHSDFLTPDNALQALTEAKIRCAKEKGQPVHFMFNNTQKTERDKGNKRALKYAWEATEDGISEFKDFLIKTKSQSLKKTVEVLNTRISLTACINNLQDRIEFIEKKQKDIQQTQKGLDKHKEDMKNNKDFEMEVEETFNIKVAVNESRWWAFKGNYGGSVCCEVCEENCHYPCTLAWYPKHCVIMQDTGNGLHCTVCTDKCHVSKHVKEKQCLACVGGCYAPNHPKTHWRYDSTTRKVMKNIKQMKAMYEKGQEGSEAKASLLETLQKKMIDLQKEKDRFLEESFKHVVKLEKIALNAVSLDTQVHLDFLIKKMVEKGDTEKVEKLREMKKKMDENPERKSALSYVSGFLSRK